MNTAKPILVYSLGLVSACCLFLRRDLHQGTFLKNKYCFNLITSGKRGLRFHRSLTVDFEKTPDFEFIL